MEALIALVVGVERVVAIEDRELGRVLERMLHVAQRVEDTAERPHVDRVVYLTIVPRVEHLWRAVHRRREQG